MAREDYMYNRRFQEIRLIIGQTGFGKKTFVQNLAKNDLFGEIKEIFWISKISLSSERKDNIKACFKEHVELKYPNNIEDFNIFLDFFQRKRDTECNDILMGENNVLNKLIVLKEVSGLAYKSESFAKFFTVSRKFNFTCVYVFHTPYPTRNCWQMIFSQTKVFNIFPGRLQTSSGIKILSFYCNRYTYEYIPHSDLWLNCLYFEISSSSKKQCLTIDMRHVNDLGPTQFRTGAENDKEQVCYYNCNKKDRAFDRFLSVRIQTSTDAIIFSMVNLIDKSNDYKDIYYKVGDELREFNNVSIQPEQRL